MERIVKKAMAIAMLAALMVFGGAPLAGVAGLPGWFKGLSVTADAALCNDKINFTEFPMLPAGESNISWSGAVAQVEIVPRWRTV